MLAHLKDDESNRRAELDRVQTHRDYDIVVEVCEINIVPVITGPQIDVTGGSATQSSTAAGREGELVLSLI